MFNNDIITHLSSMLDRTSISNVFIISKLWNRNKKIKDSYVTTINEDKLCLNMGFPKKIVNLFKSNNLSL